VYEEFFGLAQNPFLLTPDPHFLFLTPEHREALAGLVYAIVRRKGITILTGDAGTGKTTVLRTVLASIPRTLAQFGLIFHPTLTGSEFLEMVLLELGIEGVPSSKARRLMVLHELLVRSHAEGKVVVLVVDEAHKLAPEVLEEIRLLTNLETPQGKLLQIVLAAQNELDELLNRPELRQLKQRIGYRFTVKPLPVSAIGPYLRYRWGQAGAATECPFGEDAIDYLSLFSGGIPRVINAICDNALVLAFSEGVSSVCPEHIVVAAKDLALREAGVETEAADGTAANGNDQTELGRHGPASGRA
jgi:general secretion pathway protein A